MFGSSISVSSAVVLAGTVGILVAGMTTLIYVAFRRKPKNNPRAYLREEKRSDSIAVICAGDSHTHASLSSDYVAVLRARHDCHRFAFINAGQNGNTCQDLLRRLPEIVSCEPDAVTILIGTNDARAGFPEAAEHSFQQSLSALLSGLHSQTKARIALLSIPPLGEDLAAEINRGIDRCNAVIRRVADQDSADYLPFSESLRSLIERSGTPSPLRFKLRVGLLLGAPIQHYVLRRSWNEIAARRGFAVHTDQIHLNDRAGEMAADLIGTWLVSTFSRESAVLAGQL